MESTPPPDSHVDAPHRGMIPRSDLDFLPRIRWRFWLPVIAICAAFPVVWLSLRHHELVQRREALLREHAALTGPFAATYRATRDRLEGLILQSVGPWAGELRDPSLTWEGLTREPVLYARTRLGEIHDRADLAASVRHRYADQLTACLGIEFAWARELFDKGAFLLPSHVDTIRGAETPERVSALRADLRTRLGRDQAAIEAGLARRYFVLAVDEAPLSIEGPTRVYVYDARDGRPLLRARGRGDGLLLVPFRIAGLPAPSAVRGRAPTVSQHDCAIANDVRHALGIEPLGIAHAPDPDPAAPVAADAAPTVDATAAVDTAPGAPGT